MGCVQALEGLTYLIRARQIIFHLEFSFLLLSSKFIRCYLCSPNKQRVFSMSSSQLNGLMILSGLCGSQLTVYNQLIENLGKISNVHVIVYALLYECNCLTVGPLQSAWQNFEPAALRFRSSALAN